MKKFLVLMAILFLTAFAVADYTPIDGEVITTDVSDGGTMWIKSGLATDGLMNVTFDGATANMGTHFMINGINGGANPYDVLIEDSAVGCGTAYWHGRRANGSGTTTYIDSTVISGMWFNLDQDGPKTYVPEAVRDYVYLLGTTSVTTAGIGIADGGRLVFGDDATLTITARDTEGYSPWNRVAAILDAQTGHIVAETPGNWVTYTINGNEAALYVVPEPMTVVLLGLGGLFLRRRK